MRPAPDLFFFFQKALLGKSKWSEAQFQYFAIALNLVYKKKKKPYETLGY